MPKCEAKVVTVSSDDEDRFFFYSYGVSKEEYDKYVNACKEKGFTDVRFNGDSSYRASNMNGYEVNITYTANEETMTGCIEKDDNA